MQNYPITKEARGANSISRTQATCKSESEVQDKRLAAIVTYGYSLARTAHLRRVAAIPLLRTLAKARSRCTGPLPASDQAALYD